MSTRALPWRGRRSNHRRVARVEVYTTPSCPFCVRAKRLLEARGIPFDEIDVATDDDLARRR